MKYILILIYIFIAHVITKVIMLARELMSDTYVWKCTIILQYAIKVEKKYIVQK